MKDTKSLGASRVNVGVDTHRDEHVAVAIHCLGAWFVIAVCRQFPWATRASIAGRLG